MEKKTNAQALLDALDLKDRDVLDVGCGVGHLTRLMAENGARVVGLECNSAQLAKAQSRPPVAGETYRDGVAENLPFADASLDLVVMSNSLHHVPLEHQAKALAEAARVLKPGGLLYISEPVAEGPHFDLIQPVHDETIVRAEAHRVIHQEAEAVGLEPLFERTHLHVARYPSYEAFRERITTINPDTAPAFAAKDASMRAAFARLGRPEDGEIAFDQPTRVDLLRRRA